MAFFKRKTNILFLFIIFLLVAALSGASYFAYDKHNDYVVVSSNLDSNNTALAEAQKKIDDLTAKMAEYDLEVTKGAMERAELKAQLEAALAEKDRLEQENNKLKAEIEQLKIEKRRNELQDAIRLNKVNQADTAISGVCYLTFDDGPSDNTLKILNILDTYGIKATFFATSTSKNSYMSQIVNRGHAIGLHTASHKYEVIYKDINSYLDDLKQISDIVYNQTGVRSNIFRFPGGSSNTISAKYSKGIMTDLSTRMTNLGYSYFDWNVTSGDANAARVPAQTIAQTVLNNAKGKKSICVLMHDNSSKETTVEALPQIIVGLKNMGFRFEPITAETYGFHQRISN